MNKTLLAIAVSTTLFSANIMAAPGDAVPNTFTNGTPADANQVNANFNELVTQINMLAAGGTTFSYRDFGHTFNAKTYAVSTTNGSYDEEIRNYTRPAGRVIYSRNRRLSSATVKYDTLTFDNTAELRLIEFKRHDAVSLAVTETRTITPGILFRTETMGEGKTFGDDAIVNSDVNPDTYLVQTATLVSSNQTVTVPAGTYTGCIKIARHRASTNMGRIYDQINTFCPDIGLTKQVKSQYNASTVDTSLMELRTCNGGSC